MASDLASPAPSVIDLPELILCQIATYSNEKEIWSLMATCRAVRSGVQLALKPYLEKQRVPGTLPLFPNAFVSIMPDLFYYTLARRKAYRQVVTSYEALLSATPIIAESLRSLTVEVRDDDSTSGWNLIKRFGPQLQKLNLHIFGRYTQPEDVYEYIDKYKTKISPWRDFVGDGEEGVKDEENINQTRWRSPDLTMNRGLESWFKPLFPSIPLVNITNLNLHAAYHCLEHFRFIAPHVPNLRQLALHCHTTDTSFRGTYEPVSLTLEDLPFHSCVESITLTGLDGTVWYALRELAPDHRWTRLRRLVVHAFTEVQSRDGWLNETALIRLIRACTHLEELALFGPIASTFPSTIHSVAPLTFPGLKTLVVEAYDGGWSDRMPIFDDVTGNFPLPAAATLEILTLLMPELNEDDHDCLPMSTWGEENYYGPVHSLYDPHWRHRYGIPLKEQYPICKDYDLHSLFSRYPSLRYIQWINAQTTLPFVDYPALSLAENGIFSRVYRPTPEEILKRRPLQHVRAHIPICELCGRGYEGNEGSWFYDKLRRQHEVVAELGEYIEEFL